MKNRFLTALTVLSLFAVGCKDDNIGNPGEVLANTGELSSIQYNTATVVGNVYGDGITDRGMVWSEGEFPTLADFSESDGSTGAGEFTMTLTDLKEDTRYYVRSYASKGDKVSYGSVRYFNTVAFLNVSIRSTSPDLTSIAVSARIADGLETLTISERGVCYGTSPNPTTAGNKVKAGEGGKGDFNVTLTGLAMETQYYLRAYAISEEGTVYSDETTSTTLPAIPALFWGPFQTAGLKYGIVRDDNDRFVMHYTFDIKVVDDNDSSTVTITYIEPDGDRDAKHVTRAISFNGDFTEATWETISNDGKELRGISRNGIAFSLMGTAGLKFGASMSAADIYSIFTHANHGGINRCSELDQGGNQHGSISSIWSDLNLVNYIEYNGERSAITVKGGDYRGYMYRQNAFKDGAPNIPIKEDVATFSFGGVYMSDVSWAMTDQTAINETVAQLQPLLNLWENPNGVIIIQDVAGNTPAEGDFHYYAIHPQDVTWIKWRLRRYGS